MTWAKGEEERGREGAGTRDPRAVPLPDGVRLLTKADARRCAELEKVLFAGDAPWCEESFEWEIAGTAHYVGYERDGELVGYAGMALRGTLDDPEFEVHTIGVDKKAQRQGVGRTLLRHLLDVADAYGGPVFLEVNTQNDVAIALYEAHGFERLGIRRRYYQPSGADAYTMMRAKSGSCE